MRSHRNDEQRPQAELKPAALAFRRLGFGRLGLHGRIIPDRWQREQGMMTARADRLTQEVAKAQRLTTFTPGPPFALNANHASRRRTKSWTLRVRIGNASFGEQTSTSWMSQYSTRSTQAPKLRSSSGRCSASLAAITRSAA